MTDQECATALRNLLIKDGEEGWFLTFETAAVERAIELLEMDIQWVDGIPLVLIAKKKAAR